MATKRPAAEITKDEGVNIERSAHVIYPDMYQAFDPARLIIGEAKDCARQAGAKLLDIKYKYKDDVAAPLLLAMPNGIYSPTGVKTYGPNRAPVILLSVGDHYEQNENMMSMINVFQVIRETVADAIIKADIFRDRDQLLSSIFLPLLEPTPRSDREGEFFSPSIFATVNINGKSTRSRFGKYITDSAGETKCVEIVPGDLNGKNGYYTPIVRIDWVFIKKDSSKAKKKTTTDNVLLHISLCQCVVHNVDESSDPTTNTQSDAPFVTIQS